MRSIYPWLGEEIEEQAENIVRLLRIHPPRRGPGPLIPDEWIGLRDFQIVYYRLSVPGWKRGKE